MGKRLGGILHWLLTLASVACCGYLLWKNQKVQQQNDRMSSEADWVLRKFLDVRWLGGDYELPPGMDHYVSAILIFENGEYQGRVWPAVMSIQPGQSRVARCGVMWGPGPNGPRNVSFGDMFYFGGSVAEDVFPKIDGPISRCFGATDEGEIEGYRVIGFAASSEMQAGQEDTKNTFGGLKYTLKTRRFVIMHGIKLFATTDEAKKWNESQPNRNR